MSGPLPSSLTTYQVWYDSACQAEYATADNAIRDAHENGGEVWSVTVSSSVMMLKSDERLRPPQDMSVPEYIEGQPVLKCGCGWSSISDRFSLKWHAEAHGCRTAQRVLEKALTD